MNTESARIELKLKSQDYLHIQHAATVCGLSVSDFIIAASLTAAKEKIIDHKIIELSVEDQKQFAKAIINPSNPSAALEKAKEVHRQLIDSKLHEELSLAADQIDNGQTETHNMQAIIDEVEAETQ